MTRKLPPSDPEPRSVVSLPPGVGADADTALPLTLREALGVLRRRKWLVAGVFAIAIPVAAYIWLTAVPRYRAETVVRLADTRRAVTAGLVPPPATGIGRSVDPLQTEAGVIASRAMIGEVVDSSPSLRLVSDDMSVGLLDQVEFVTAERPDSIVLRFDGPAFTAIAPGGQVGGTYGAPLELGGIRFAVRRRPGTESATLRVVGRDAAVSRILQRLEAKPRHQTDIIDISYEDSDSARARFVVNQVAVMYRMANARDARQQARLQREFLEAQIEISDSLLQVAQGNLSGFRSTAGTYRQQSPQADLAGLLVRREEMRTDLERFRALLAQLRGKSPETRRDALRAAMTHGEVAGNVEAAALDRQLVSLETTRDSLTLRRPATSPDVQRVVSLIAITETRLATALDIALQSVIATTEARMATLENFRAQTDANLRQSSETEAREAWLQRQAETAGGMSEQLREQLRRAQLAERLEVGQVQILDPAVTAFSVGVGAFRKVALILMVGLMLGVGIAFVSEHLKTSISGQKEIVALGLPVLGIVPRLKDTNGGGTKSSTPVIEALRGVRLNLVYAHGTAGSLMATITSPSKGDGKSFVASNLALAFAYAGHQTLLIDGDVRRGVLHHLLGRPRKPGLTDYLVGRIPSDKVIQKTQFPRLDFIASGMRTSQAPEFLGSPAMTQLVMSLRSAYGVILVDSPPLGAGVDALSLGAVTGNMMLIVRGGTTDRAATEAKLDLVERLPIRILGCVVNAVRGEEGDEYHSYYMEGYELEDEEGAPGSQLLQQSRPSLGATKKRRR